VGGIGLPRYRLIAALRNPGAALRHAPARREGRRQRRARTPGCSTKFSCAPRAPGAAQPLPATLRSRHRVSSLFATVATHRGGRHCYVSCANAAAFTGDPLALTLGISEKFRSRQFQYDHQASDAARNASPASRLQFALTTTLGAAVSLTVRLSAARRADPPRVGEGAVVETCKADPPLRPLHNELFPPERPHSRPSNVSSHVRARGLGASMRLTRCCRQFDRRSVGGS
jgi:hypothetical protein